MIRDGVAVVVIGRNEGERLRRCLTSTMAFDIRVYVDSGSTDGSQELARKLGFEVLALDVGSGFTAAKARNRGIFYIAEKHPEAAAVLTIDGDCEFVPSWLGSAAATLRNEADVAVVFGRRRERFPDKNIYHAACEIEWEVLPGDVASCGGDALFRMSALTAVGGYNPQLIAGEEPDLCFRLRKQGWRIRSDHNDMTLHDVDINVFRQWWQRAKRAGHGIAELYLIHVHNGGDASWRRFLFSALLWSGLMLLTAAFLMTAFLSWSGGMLAAAAALTFLCVLQIVRVAPKARSALPSRTQNLKWSALVFVSKLAQVQGALLYLVRRRSHERTLIEYK